jgi:hypothetical protein
MLETRSILALEDALSKEHQDFIESFVTSDQFPWFFQHDISGGGHEFDDKNYFPSGGLTHVCYLENKINSRYFNEEVNFEGIVVDLAKAFSVELAEILRIKLNLTTPVPGYSSHNYCTPHTDSAEPHWVFLYYINDSDGDTIFFQNPANNEKELLITYRSTPKKGKCILFDGSIWHTQSNPMTSPTRINLNANVSLL